MIHQLPKKRMRQKFGLCDYKGPDLKTAESSIIELFVDDCEATGLPQLAQSQCMERVRHTIRDYIDSVECNLNRVQSSQQAADLADKMKEDDKFVQLLVESIYTAIEAEDKGVLDNLVYTPNYCIGYSICSSCPYYLKPNVCLIGAWMIGENSYQEVIFENKFNLRSSLLIIKIILNVLHYIICHTSGQLAELLRFKCLLEDLQLLMGVYKMMNPTGDEIDRQEDALYSLLTQPRQEISPSEHNYWSYVLSTVFDDINSSKLPYVREMQRCINTSKKELAEGFRQSDYYLSMKSTPQIREGKGERNRKSLLNSVIERDSFKNAPATRSFDAFTGYKSYYLEDTDTIDCPIKTLMIQNPGKFKNRGIHLAENAIQDRCNLIHRCLSQGLKIMRTDCSHKQENGRAFAKALTNQWKFSPKTERIGIYCLDFSNATDTMDQDFQNKILGFVLDPVISDYWNLLSKSPKTFYRANRERIQYTQQTGQPQGLLGSFDAFSIAHHFMMLMVMKHLNFEKYPSEYFYRILGDDSIINSIEPEDNFEEFSVLDTYKRVCHYANFFVNDDKGIYTHSSSMFAQASFAKVNFMNGETFSPTPFRLATMYLGTSAQMTELGHLGVALWRGSVGYPGYQEFLHSSLSRFSSGPWIIKMLESGKIHSLECFDVRSKLTNSQEGRASYCLALSILDSSIQEMLMDDKELSFRNPRKARNSFNDLFKLLPEKELELVPMEHKIFEVLESNNRVDNFYSDLFNLDSLDDKCLRICSELIERKIQGDVVDDAVSMYDLIQTEKVIRLALNNPLVDVSEVFPESTESLALFLKNIKLGLMTRGLTKRPTRIAYILQNSFELYMRLDDVLGRLSEDTGILPEESEQSFTSSR